MALPCSWKVGVDESTCHIQWTNPVDTVFEQRGELTWQADSFEGRLGVSKQQLASGDCSLTIRDVQIGDAGSYDSFMVVDGARAKKTRVFIRTVKLQVLGRFVVLDSCVLVLMSLLWLVLMGGLLFYLRP